MSHLNLELEQLEERVAPLTLGVGLGIFALIGLDLGHDRDCRDDCDKDDCDDNNDNFKKGKRG
jgi:hypothetical protein